MYASILATIVTVVLAVVLGLAYWSWEVHHASYYGI